MNPLTKILGAAALFLLVGLGVTGWLLLRAHEDLGVERAVSEQRQHDLDHANDVLGKLKGFQDAMNALAQRLDQYNAASRTAQDKFDHDLQELRTNDHEVDDFLRQRLPQPVLDRLCDSGLVADDARAAVCPDRVAAPAPGTRGAAQAAGPDGR